MNLDEITAHLPRIPHPVTESLYDQLIGELIFSAINTQPLSAQPVNALARFMPTANSELYQFVNLLKLAYPYSLCFTQAARAE